MMSVIFWQLSREPHVFMISLSYFFTHFSCLMSRSFHMSTIGHDGVKTGRTSCGVNIIKEACRHKGEVSIKCAKFLNFRKKVSQFLNLQKLQQHLTLTASEVCNWMLKQNCDLFWHIYLSHESSCRFTLSFEPPVRMA